METALLHLVLYIASSSLAEVTQDLRQYPFQRVVLHFAARSLARVVDCFITVLLYIERCALKVA